jgi:ADP-heptose:LPS heptosyltransferase
LAVGVIWKAGEWDDRRSLPVSLLSRLTEVPNITLHALQRGDELRNWLPHFGAISGSDQALDLAQIMRQLDLIISVDSFTAHLAGALACPTWTLLHADADWRWMRGRDDSPWYPTMRLYRQPRAGDWNSVVSRVAADLDQLSQCPLKISPVPVRSSA